MHVAAGVVEPGWGSVEELLATLVELVDAGNLLFYKAHTDKGTPTWDPVRIVRPGHAAPVDEPKKMATPAEMAAFFGMRIEYTPPGDCDG